MRRDRDGSLLDELDDDVHLVPVAAAVDTHTCEGGWAGEDDQGRPYPCARCRPHLRRTGRLTVVPPSTATLAMSEREWQRMVCDLAELRSWRWHHVHNSRGSGAGWPDLIMCRGPRLLALELKRETGRPTADQLQWLDALRLTGAEAFVLRPRDWPFVQELLA